jgi:putative DNA primase/helicase
MGEPKLAPPPAAEAWSADSESHDALAVSFINTHGERLRWIQQWGQWHRWTETRWQRDRVLHVFDLVRELMRERAATAAKPDKMLDAGSIASVERLARSDPRVAAVPEQFDADPWLLNTPAGIVDLTTGDLLDHDPARMLTKQTSVHAEGDCPRWLQFLDEVTGGDAELVNYLQRIAGYSITGSTREHVFFFLHGTGRNGKGVFLNTLRRVLADYATVSGSDVFTASRQDRHPTELAALRGARLVIAQEVEEGREWAEARIKALTGGDPISARYMRQDFFEFTPEFKLLIAGNHKPRLNNVDPAIRARLHLVPFTVTIPAEKRDPDLPEKLAAEGPGIMAWILRGCLAYQRDGLAPPEAVTSATTEYFNAQDSVTEFLSEHCETGPDFWELRGQVFASWQAFCKSAGYEAGRLSEFNEKVRRAGFTEARTNARGRHWLGLKLRPTTAEKASHWSDFA